MDAVEFVFWMPFVAVPCLIVGAGWANVRNWRTLRAAGWRWTDPPKVEKPAHDFADAASVEVDGGALIGWWTVSSPLATATVDEDYIKIDAFMRVVWLDRRVARSVIVLKAAFGRAAVVFRSDTEQWEGVVFYPSRFAQETWLDALERFNWPVDDQHASADPQPSGHPDPGVVRRGR